MAMDSTKKQLRDKLQDDINELTPGLQALLETGANRGMIEEEEVISEIDDMEGNIKLLEKFYDLSEKLGIKIVTIEELLEKEQESLKKRLSFEKLRFMVRRIMQLIISIRIISNSILMISLKFHF